MTENQNLTELLRNKSIDLSKEELEQIMGCELLKSEEERNGELVDLCLEALKEIENKDEKKPCDEKKKPFPWKPLLFIVIAVLIIILNVTLIPSLRSKASAAFQETVSITVTESTTKAPTTSAPDVFINFLYKPQEILFCQDGKTRLLTEEMSLEVIKEINEVTRENEWTTLKMAVTPETVKKIKSENTCIEICYDGIHLLNNLKGESVKGVTYNFEKVLIVLDGEYKNIFFFMKDGEYLNGPITPLHSDLSEEILEDISD